MVSFNVDDTTAAMIAAAAAERGLSVEELLREQFAARILPTEGTNLKADSSDGSKRSPNYVPGTGPKGPIDFDTLERELDELSFNGPSLPDDFSRADIYLDHD